jgi:ABC-type Fe3+ transport system permease subunit/DNA-binding beta-propeller fold protein YncE
VNWILLKNSLMVSALATALAVALGWGVALWLVGLRRGWRRAALALSIVAFALPAFLVTGIWIDLLGNAGALRDWLPLNIYSLGGCAWILGLMTWPITTAAVWLTWRRIERDQLDSDPMLRGRRLIEEFLYPVARPALGVAVALTFVLTLNQFSVPAILQVKVYPAEIWLRFNTAYDVRGALMMSWPLLLAPALLLAALRTQRFRMPHGAVETPAGAFRDRLGGLWHGAAGVVAIVTLALSAALPLMRLLFGGRLWSDFGGALAANQQALWHSFIFAFLGATLILTLGLAAWRRRAVGVFWMSFFLPGALLGVALILIFNRPLFSAIYEGAGIVLLALAVRYLAVGWAGARMTLRSIDRDVLDFARLSGASQWERFRHAILPQSGAALAGVWYVLFLFCLWDVDAVLLIVPPGTQTLSMQIFGLLHYGHNSQVDALCALLLLLALAPLATYAVGRFLMTRFAAIQARPRLAVCGLAAMAGMGCAPGDPDEGRADVAAIESRFFTGVEIWGARGVGAGQFNKPRSLAVDAEDNLYVVDMTGRVQKFSEKGDFILQWQMPETDRGRPKGMYADHLGNVVVIEPHYSRINHHGVDGSLVTQWGVHGTEPGLLAFPRAVTMNSRNELYVSEFGVVERVQRFSGDGHTFQLGFGRGGDGPGEFNRPEGLGIDSLDRVYVADSCNHRIQIFLPEGEFLWTYGQAGSGVGELSYPYDIRIDGAGNQYVCEFGNSRLQIFDADRKSIEVIGGPGPEPGRFANPWSIVLDSKGNLYVADSANHRVQKLLRRAETWKPRSVPARRSNQPNASHAFIATPDRKLQLADAATVGATSGERFKREVNR